MLLLKDVRTLFRRRRRPVEIEVGDTQARDLADVDGNTRGRATALGLIEPKPARFRGGAETVPPNEVIGLVRRIGDHLDTQTERTERLLTLMNRLPHALDALPEINRQNARLLEALHDHFGQAQRREEALNATLGALHETSGRQTDVLGLVQQHLDHSTQTAANLSGTLDTLHLALRDLAESNGRSAEVLSQMSESTTRREAELAATISHTQRWMIFAVFVCAAASITAIVVSSLALTQ